MDLAEVVQLPARQTARLADDAVGAVRQLSDSRRWWGDVDDWGRDAGLFRLVTAASEVRWHVSTGGAARIPARRGALVVVNTQRLSLTPIFSSFAIGRACNRPARYVGRPDDSPLGAFAQRLGGLIDHPDEVTGALRANQLVIMAAEPSRRSREAGEVNHQLVGAALALGAPIIPAATTSSPFSRRARVEIGQPVKTRRRRRGPLAELELADDIRDAIGLLLDEMGNIGTGTPLDWLPLSGLGGN